jgi:hypothetical protein
VDGSVHIPRVLYNVRQNATFMYFFQKGGKKLLKHRVFSAAFLTLVMSFSHIKHGVKLCRLLRRVVFDCIPAFRKNALPSSSVLKEHVYSEQTTQLINP